MKNHTSAWQNQARIVVAIAAKDILEALKNKSTLAVVISALFVVVAYSILPKLTRGGEPPNLLVYNASSSDLAERLETSKTFQVYNYKDEGKFFAQLGNGDIPELGLLIPADFSLAPDGQAAASLQGYALYWVKEDDLSELKRLAEDEISTLTGQDHPIEIQEQRIYPQGTDHSRGLWAGLSLVFMSVMIGISLIPQLILEEKQAHTLEAILVSPANSYQFVAGKAIAGLFFCLAGALVVFIFYADIVLHWWIAVLAALAIASFAVSVGLWLGMRIENRGQLTMVAWILIIPLFMPVMMSLLAELFPAWLAPILKFIPTVTGLNLLLNAFSKQVSLVTIAFQFGWIIFCSTLVLLGVAHMLRRRDRSEAPSRAGWSAGLGESLSRIIPWRRSPEPADQSIELNARTEKGSAPSVNQWEPGIPLSRPEPADLPERLRLVWVIAAKDIRDAIRNRLFISIMIGVTLLSSQSFILPLLLRGSNTPTAAVYDQGDSAILDGMSTLEGIRLIPVNSRMKLEETITGSPRTILGLVIPADFDQQVAEGGQVRLESYMIHWADEEKIAAWADEIEGRFHQVGAPGVTIQSAATRVYPAGETAGQPMITLFVMIIGIITIGAALVPLLFIEEKEAHTMEVLMVSPASLWQIVAAKLITGLFYGAIAALVLLAFNNYLIVNWGVAILAAITSIVFAAAIGLLIGVLSDNPTTTGLWGSLVILVLLATTFVQFFQDANLPPFVQSLIRWSPGTAMVSLFRSSMTRDIPGSLLLSSLVALLGASLVLYLVSGAILRRKLR